MGNNISWKSNYKMTLLEWNYDYFKKLVGGIHSTLDEKNKCLREIKVATLKNRQGFVTEVDKEYFLKAYPDSLDYIVPYYHSLEYAYSKNNRSNDVYMLRYDRHAMLMIYAPFFVSLSMDELNKIAKQFDMNIVFMWEIIYFYKKEISKDEKYKEDLIDKYDISFIEKIIDEYVSSGLSILDILKKYDIKKSVFDRYMRAIMDKNPNLYKEIKETFANPSDKRWKVKYSMSSSEWNKKYFATIIGGIKVTDDEKEECINMMKDAILKNNNGILVELNKEILLKAYPDSLDLLKDYYDSLIYAHKIESNSQYKVVDPNQRYSSKKWEDILIKDRNVMLLVYAPYLSGLTVEELGKYAKMFDLNMKKISDLITRYKRSFSLDVEDKNSLTDDMKYDLNIIRQIVNDILVNDFTKIKMEKKYKLGSFTFDSFMEQLKSIDIDSYNQVAEKLKRNSEKYFFKMNELIPTMYEFIVNGINVGDKKMSFTMLDYYCLTNKNSEDVVSFLKEKSSQQAFKLIRNRIFKFFQSTKNVGPFVSAEGFANHKIVFICNDKRVEFDLDLSAKVIDFLRENGIPTNYQIVYIAAGRIARGEPVLPLKNISFSIDNKLENVKKR